MKRINPVVRALCDRVRHPGAKQILGGLLLVTPLMTLRTSSTPVAAATIAAPVALTPVNVSAPPKAIRLLGSDARAARTATTAAAAAPDQKPGGASQYAKRFGISPSLASHIHTAALNAGISPQVAFGLVRAESSFRTAAVSPVGAIGLTQLMPATARWLEPGISKQQLRAPETNLRIGFKYLRNLIDKYNGNEKLALTAFNRGPGTVDKLLKRGRNPDNGYADKVITGKSDRHVALMNKKFGGRK